VGIEQTIDGVREASPVRDSPSRIYPWLLVLTLAVATLAFGSVYPWAYWPLSVCAGLLGGYGLFNPAVRKRGTSGGLWFGVALLVLSASVQLIPLNREWILHVSPNTDLLLRERNLSYALEVASGERAFHPLSIEPSNTLASVVALAALGVMALGLSRTLDGFKIRAIVPVLILTGAVLAIVGIVQASLDNGKIFGVWVPFNGPQPFTPAGGSFGPFINRNHFAGWMLMALPVSFGYLIAEFETASTLLGASRQRQLEWLSSPRGSRFALAATGVAIMSLSLVLTLSRSGIGAFLVAAFLTALAALRRHGTKSKGTIVAICIFALALFVMMWAGLDTISSRLDEADRDSGFRFGAWQDAIAVFQRHPLVGTGMNTYGEAMLSYQTFKVGSLHFAQAHNDYLELLAEGGLLVTIAVVIAGTMLAREIRRRFAEASDDATGYWVRMGATTSLVAIALQESFDFSLQIPANEFFFAIICALAVRKATGRRSAASTRALRAAT
jgi:hypothetical protein